MGIILQDQNDHALGYIKSLDHDLCLDCFNLKHYSKVRHETVVKGDMPQVSEAALIIYVLSVNHLSLRLKIPSRSTLSKFKVHPRLKSCRYT